MSTRKSELIICSQITTLAFAKSWENTLIIISPIFHVSCRAWIYNPWDEIHATEAINQEDVKNELFKRVLGRIRDHEKENFKCRIVQFEFRPSLEQSRKTQLASMSIYLALKCLICLKKPFNIRLPLEQSRKMHQAM